MRNENIYFCVLFEKLLVGSDSLLMTINAVLVNKSLKNEVSYRVLHKTQ